MIIRLFAGLGAVILAPLLGGLVLAHGAPQSARAPAEFPIWSAIDATGPAARWDHTLAADPETGSLLLFGVGGDAGPLADLWMLAGVGGES